ncbi:hypothetical protein KI387_006256, partial [Taxus chinensis]
LGWSGYNSICLQMYLAYLDCLGRILHISADLSVLWETRGRVISSNGKQAWGERLGREAWNQWSSEQQGRQQPSGESGSQGAKQANQGGGEAQWHTTTGKHNKLGPGQCEEDTHKDN